MRTTKAELQRFMESFLWKDMKVEIGSWIRELRELAVTLAMQCAMDEGVEKVESRLAAIGGRLEALRYVLELPQNMLKELEDAGRDETN